MHVHIFIRQGGVRSKDTVLSKPKGAPKDKLSHYRVAPFYYFQVNEIYDQCLVEAKPDLVTIKKCIQAFGFRSRHNTLYLVPGKSASPEACNSTRKVVHDVAIPSFRSPVPPLSVELAIYSRKNMVDAVHQLFTRQR